MRLRDWIESREIESKPSRLNVIVEVIAALMIFASAIASAWLLLYVIVNHY